MPADGTVRFAECHFLLMCCIDLSRSLRIFHKLAFHDADTDIDFLARILAHTSDTRDWSYSCGKLNDTPTFSRRSSQGYRRGCRCRCRRRGMRAIPQNLSSSVEFWITDITIQVGFVMLVAKTPIDPAIGPMSVFTLLLYCVITIHQCYRRTDGQTDRRTDGRHARVSR